ncbi:hypothetical protein S83_051710 [Arachis hypogaea]
MTAKSHPAAMRFIPDQISRDSISNNYISSSSDSLRREPARCLILRVNGELSLLDLDDGRERNLTDSVELFWVTCGQSEDKTNLIEEVSWLDYGHRGMQVWYPSPGANSFKQEDFLQLDPELEFDREVYPLGLLPNAGVVVGVSQRMSFLTGSEFPCFEPSPQAQTILHCLLHHLLQTWISFELVSVCCCHVSFKRDKIEEALRLADLSAEKPHFSHCLEWLLFTVFEADISRYKRSTYLYELCSTTLPKSTINLLEIYYKSVGPNCHLLLNVPPNSSGLISPEDIQVLQEFIELRRSIFSNNFAINALLQASSTRGEGGGGGGTCDS